MYKKILGLLLLLTFFLPACLGRTSEPVSSETVTIPSKAPTPLYLTATLASFPTRMPTPTKIPTETLVPLPIKPPPPSESLRLDRIRTIYVEDGNIYLQDGTNPPIQLTNSGEDRNPIISDDGEKIVFYRGEAYDNVYSINADGSNEQLIIKSEALPVLGQGDVQALTIIPDTHILLFNTYLCNPWPGVPSYNAPDCTIGIYEIDMDMDAGVRSILQGFHGNMLQYRNFEVSPDGRFLAVASSGHIDIYNRRGDFVHKDAIIYDRTRPDEFLPKMYWLPDSSGMIAIVATDVFNEPTTPPHTYAALRYNLDENIVVPIALGATIMNYDYGCNFSVSPDRNWILFMGNETGDPGDWPSVYLGNLNTGHTQQYTDDGFCPPWVAWNSDSRYFAAVPPRGSRQIGDVEGAPIRYDEGFFSRWIDSSHYLYAIAERIDDKDVVKGYIVELGGESIPVPEELHWFSTFVIMSPEE